MYYSYHITYVSHCRGFPSIRAFCACACPWNKRAHAVAKERHINKDLDCYWNYLFLMTTRRHVVFFSLSWNNEILWTPQIVFEISTCLLKNADFTNIDLCPLVNGSNFDLGSRNAPVTVTIHRGQSAVFSAKLCDLYDAWFGNAMPSKMTKRRVKARIRRINRGSNYVPAQGGNQLTRYTMYVKSFGMRS